jgi:hypothetical protein
MSKKVFFGPLTEQEAFDEALEIVGLHGTMDACKIGTFIFLLCEEFSQAPEIAPAARTPIISQVNNSRLEVPASSLPSPSDCSASKEFLLSQ